MSNLHPNGLRVKAFNQAGSKNKPFSQPDPEPRVTKEVVQRHRFNENKSSIVWAYSRVNQAWIVFREDSGLQIGVRLHNNFDDAQDDYRNRVSFLSIVESAS